MSRFWSSVVMLSALTFFVLPIRAEIVLEGTAEEKAELQSMIDSLSFRSMTAASAYAELEARPEKVKISFGKTKFGGEATYADRRVVLDKDIIGCIKFKDSIGGNDGAEAAMALDLILAHEALGHQLNHLLNLDSSENGAMGLMNLIRDEIGVVRRLTYPDKDSGIWVSKFSDGSFADFTPARRKSNKLKTGGNPNKTSGLIETSGTIQLVGTSGLGGSIDLGLDPASGVQTVTLDGSEYGSSIQTIELSQLDATLVGSTAVFDAPNLMIDSLDMAFGEFLLENGLTSGLNTANMFEPGVNAAGDWDYLGGLTDFNFDLSADLLLTNGLFQLEGDDGIASSRLTGLMQYDSGSGTWLGTATLDGGLFVRAVPEPSTMVIIGLTLAMLAGKRRRSQLVPPTIRSPRAGDFFRADSFFRFRI